MAWPAECRASSQRIGSAERDRRPVSAVSITPSASVPVATIASSEIWDSQEKHQVRVAPESKMKAILQHTYGSPDVLELRDIDRPAVKDDEVLVRVRAAAVNIGDWHLLSLDYR